MKDIKLGKNTITLTKFGAIEGWKLLHRLGSIAGPALGHAADDNTEKAISVVFEKCSEDELIELIKQLTNTVLVDGKTLQNFNEDFKDYSFTMELCAKVIEYNFKDFFSKLAMGLKGIQGISKGT
jgi:hypothetical protein